MTTVIRIGWVIYGVYQLLLALGSFPYSSLGALVFWGAAAGTAALFMRRSTIGGYVGALLTGLGPFVVNAAGEQFFGAPYLTGNLLVAVLMAWAANIYVRRRAAEAY